MGMDRDHGIDKHLPLRRVEFHILLSLAAGERHGYGIILEIEGRRNVGPRRRDDVRALARMGQAGLIEAARRPALDAADERRNYYRSQVQACALRARKRNGWNC